MNNDPHNDPRANRIQRFLSGLLFGLFAATLFLLLFGAYCTFTHKKWAMSDYGVYVNMLWNTGRGDWFRCLVDKSYLSNHLSFSLAPVGLLFHAWDSPLLLMVVQWVAFCGGCLFIARACARHRLPPVMTAAALFFYAAWPFTQSVLLSSFHGVCMYLLLLPWLYYTCAFNRRWAFLPLILLLGLREDAFFYALPVLLYFAVRDRWTGGYAYAAAALLYGWLALFVLYPWINGVSLFARRGDEVSADAVGALFSSDGLRARAGSMLLIGLPFLPLIRRGVGRAALLAAVPVVFTMASGFARQHELRNHYPAIVMAGMVMGMTEALGTGWDRTRRRPWDRPETFAALLLGLTVAAHLHAGFLYFGRHYHARVGWPHASGRMILRAAKQIPKEGVLVVPFELGGVCANRADVLSWRNYKPAKHAMDLVFCRLDHLVGRRGKPYRDLLARDGFGVRYFDGHYVTMQKSWPASRNAEALDAAARYARTVPMARTLCHAGRNLMDRQGDGVRHWKPGKTKPPITVAFGKGIRLEPGSYRAILRFRSVPPAKGSDWGRFELFAGKANEPLTAAPIEASNDLDYREQTLTFAVGEAAAVEPRITAGWAPLWLLDVEFQPR